MLDTFTVKEATCMEREEEYRRGFDLSKSLLRTVYEYVITTMDGRTLRYCAGGRKKSFPPAWPFYVELRDEDHGSIYQFFKKKEWRATIDRRIASLQKTIDLEQAKLNHLKSL